MSKAIREHIRSNVVGYVAIFMFAMGGAAYANHPGGTNTIDSADIINNQVRGVDVRDDTVANGGLGAADLGPDSVGSSEVAPDSLDAVDLNAGSVGASEVSDESLGSGDLGPSSVGSGEVATDAIGSSEVASGAIGSSEVAADSLAAANLAPDSVGNSELAPDAVGSAELVDGAVTNAKLGIGAVESDNLDLFAVTNSKIFPSAVTASKIAADVVGQSDIATDGVAGAEIANGSLTTAEFASSIPAVRVTRTTDQNTLNDTGTSLNFTSERYDTAGMHSNTSNLSRLTAPVTGIYAVTVGIKWQNQPFASGRRVFVLRKNGATEVGIEEVSHSVNPNGGPHHNFATMLRLEAGDYLEARVVQNSGGTLPIVASQGENGPNFSMTWLAPGP